MSVERYVQSDPRSRPKPFTFLPPKPNGFVTGTVKALLPYLLKKVVKVTEVEIDGLERLKALQGERTLISPSHSGGFEPYVIMHLSTLLDEDYYYLAAREAFERSPAVGWIMQRVGAYSIIRGTADRLSFQTTRKLLAEGKRPLVIFPEGQTVWQNDTVIPFQEGVTQLAFKACEETSGTHLHLVPIAVKYLFIKDMHPEIDASLARLEGRLFDGTGETPPHRYDRLRRIGEALLSANEKKCGVKPGGDSDLNLRIQGLKEFIVARSEKALNLSPKPGEALLDRVRNCFNAVDRIVNEEMEGSDYERELWTKRKEEARQLYDGLWRVLDFVAIYDGYVREAMTVERFMDVLCLLETEVFGKRRLWGPRRAVVRIGEPIDLANHFENYKADKKETVRKVTMELELSVKRMLDEMNALAAPLIQ